MLVAIRKYRPVLLTVCLVIIIISGFLVMTGKTEAQQDDSECSTVAQNILNIVEEVCSNISKDQLCYGNVSIELSPSDNASSIRFEKEGDIANLEDVSSLQLKTLDYVSEEWGVALMKVETDLGEAATIVLFGNVEIENKGEALVRLPMVTNTGVNVRLQARANGQLIGSLPTGTEVIANGRLTNLEGEEWIRFDYSDAPGKFAWILGAALSSDGDRTTLNTVESSTSRPFGPMRAFTFSSQPGDRPCGQAADSGIMIQTPSGVGEINFLINEVSIEVGSTVYFQAQPQGNLSISTLDGAARVTSNGTTRIIPKGARARVEMNESLEPVGVPSLPRPYDEEDVNPLWYFDAEDVFDEDFQIDDPFFGDCLVQFNREFNDGVSDPFGDEVSSFCVAEYDDQFLDEYVYELPDSCFDEEGNIADDCLVDFTDVLPDTCFDETTGEYDFNCGERLLQELPDSCLDGEETIAGCLQMMVDLPESCFDSDENFAQCAAEEIEYLPEGCFDDETGDVDTDCVQIVNDLPEECFDPDTDIVDDTCYDDFVEGLPDQCFEESGDFVEGCVSIIEDLPLDCFDADTNDVDDSCYDDYLTDLSGDCYNVETGEFDYDCYEEYDQDYGSYSDEIFDEFDINFGEEDFFYDDAYDNPYDNTYDGSYDDSYDYNYDDSYDYDSYDSSYDDSYDYNYDDSYDYDSYDDGYDSYDTP